MNRRDFLQTTGVAGLALLGPKAFAQGDMANAPGAAPPFLALRSGTGFEPYPFSVRDLFAERAAQFASWGIPPEAVERARGAIAEPWSDEAGGWSYEWSQLAAEFAGRKEWLPASLCLGAARFPIAATPLRTEAARRQPRYFAAAMDTFPMSVRRHVVAVPYRNGRTAVAVLSICRERRRRPSSSSPGASTPSRSKCTGSARSSAAWPVCAWWRSTCPAPASRN